MTAFKYVIPICGLLFFVAVAFNNCGEQELIDGGVNSASSGGRYYEVNYHDSLNCADRTEDEKFDLKLNRYESELIACTNGGSITRKYQVVKTYQCMNGKAEDTGETTMAFHSEENAGCDDEVLSASLVGSDCGQLRNGETAFFPQGELVETITCRRGLYSDQDIVANPEDFSAGEYQARFQRMLEYRCNDGQMATTGKIVKGQLIEADNARCTELKECSPMQTRYLGLWAPKFAPSGSVHIGDSAVDANGAETRQAFVCTDGQWLAVQCRSPYNTQGNPYAAESDAGCRMEDGISNSRVMEIISANSCMEANLPEEDETGVNEVHCRF